MSFQITSLVEGLWTYATGMGSTSIMNSFNMVIQLALSMKASLTTTIFIFWAFECSKLIVDLFLMLPKLRHVRKLFATRIRITSKNHSLMSTKMAIECIVLNINKAEFDSLSSSVPVKFQLLDIRYFTLSKIFEQTGQWYSISVPSSGISSSPSSSSSTVFGITSDSLSSISIDFLDWSVP